MYHYENMGLPITYWICWRAIGYRRIAGGKAGTWLARYYDAAGERGRKYHSIGTADDLLDADGVATMTWAQAQDAARNWFTTITWQQGKVIEPETVEQAMTAYVTDYKARGGKDEKGLNSTIDAHVLPKLGDKKLTDLTTGMIRAWLRGVVTAPPRIRQSKKPNAKPKVLKPVDPDNADRQRARRASANRILTVLKAALNLAYADNKVPSDDAWRRVSPYKNANAPRIRDFTDAEAKRLVNASSDEFRSLVQAALLCGARYGELGRLRAADFNASTAMLHIRAGKTEKARDVTLTDEAVKLFKILAAGKAKNALILTQPDGIPWGKNHQSRPMNAACKVASIIPPIGLHILRHAYASRLVMAGVPLGAVAAQIGDSEVTCAKHYAHHSPKSVSDAVRHATADLDIVPESNVVSLGS